MARHTNKKLDDICDLYLEPIGLEGNCFYFIHLSFFGMVIKIRHQHISSPLSFALFGNHSQVGPGIPDFLCPAAYVMEVMGPRSPLPVWIVPD